MNKKENPGVSRRWAAMLLLFSLAVSVLLGFAMPVHAADGGRTTLRTLRVGFYPYTGYMATAADGSRSGYAYELLQDIAQYENVTFAYSCLNGNNQQAMQQLAAGQIDLIPVLRRTAERDEQFAFSAEPIGTVATMLRRHGRCQRRAHCCTHCHRHHAAVFCPPHEGPAAWHGKDFPHARVRHHEPRRV